VRTLELILPDIRRATWEDIVELRKDRGLRKLRDRLRECDAAGGADAGVVNRIWSEYQKDMERYRPTWRSKAVDVFWNLVSLAPAIGIIPTVIQTGKAITDVLGARDRWTASLMPVKSHIEK
jgi:hypothetical protein